MINIIIQELKIINCKIDITIEKLMLGGEKINKSALARQYNCCWRTIDRRLNPQKTSKRI